MGPFLAGLPSSLNCSILIYSTLHGSSISILFMPLSANRKDQKICMFSKQLQVAFQGVPLALLSSAPPYVSVMPVNIYGSSALLIIEVGKRTARDNVYVCCGNLRNIYIYIYIPFSFVDINRNIYIYIPQALIHNSEVRTLPSTVCFRRHLAPCFLCRKPPRIRVLFSCSNCVSPKIVIALRQRKKSTQMNFNHSISHPRGSKLQFEILVYVW